LTKLLNKSASSQKRLIQDREISSVLNRLKRDSENDWVKAGQNEALLLFHAMAKRVPAYKDFLKKNDINPARIKTASDLTFVPTTDKENYLKAYPLEQLCWDGKFKEDRWVISSTSGSTGKPFYFPRQSEQDDQYALLAEIYLITQFNIDKKSTLYIDAFAMGTWIGGVFTYEAVRRVAERGYNLSLTTPGINIPEILNQVRELGPHFDQVIIGCYPPIMKDIIDEGIEAGLDWGRYNLGIVFSAEGFNENFRDYIVENAKLNHGLKSTLNHYGTVDLGTMAYETPISALIRRLALRNEGLHRRLFVQPHKLPTLAQFIPELHYFEEDNGRLICSARSGLPLMRYDLKDHGTVLSFMEMQSYFAEAGIDILSEARKNGIDDTVWNLPFVQVFERADFSVGFLGFQVYPETVRKALTDASLSSEITGKFTLVSDYDDHGTPSLTVHVEMKNKHKPSEKLRDEAERLIIYHLIRENAEFRVNYETFPGKAHPTVEFWDYEHQEHFGKKGKHRWVKK
jgi:phenylacetate-CoA ligase